MPLYFFDSDRGRQTLVGVLQVINKRDGMFDKSDAATLEALGGFAASVLTRAALSERLERQFLGIIASLAEAVDAKDPYTAGHSRRVAAYSLAQWRALDLDLDEMFNLHIAGLLHDIGKIAVPDAILLKNGRLTDEEFEVIKTHTREGVRITQPVSMTPIIYEGIL